ncbi:MAG: hypothetical protein U0V87_00935 [Acidobacteriota bacterium]
MTTVLEAPASAATTTAPRTEEIAQSAIAAAESAKGDRHVALIGQLAHDLPSIEPSVAPLLQATLITLLTAAITRTERGIVALAARAVPNTEGPSLVRITVTDTGIGRATGYAYDACAPLVDRFGGSLSVESAPGVGSCFTLEFDPSRPAR